MKDAPYKPDLNPAGCTLMPCVRNLIERAYLETTGKAYGEGYQIVWLPDLQLGPPYMRVAHDCMAMPVNCLGLGVKRKGPVGGMDVRGELFMMCNSPAAGHAVYTAACENCKSVYLISAWDRQDTLANYVQNLKGRK